MATKRRPGRPRKEDAIRRWPMVRVSPRVRAILDALAAEQGVSRREFLDELVRKHLESLDAKERKRLERIARERLEEE